MNNLFNLKDGEMVLAVPVFKLKGKAKYVFEMLYILGNTKADEDDFYWWAIRGDILARDKDRQDCGKLELRMN